MPPRRVFLGLSDACLPLAARHLLTEHGTDLSALTVVTPGARAGRRLRELLVVEAESLPGASRPFLPPHFITPAALPEELYVAPGPIADTLATRLAWIASLRAAEPTLLRALVRRAPAPDAFLAWNRLAGDLERLHAETGAARLDFPTVADLCREHPGFCDAGRWEAMACLHRRYLQALAEAGLADRYQAWMEAAASGAARPERQVILVGLLEVNAFVRELLARTTSPVTALIFAPAEEAGDYDEFGALRPEAWEQRPLSIPDDAVRIAERPCDQAQEVVGALAGLGGRFPADRITVGLGDEALLPAVRRALETVGVPVRAAHAGEVRESPPALLLAAIAEYLEEPRCDRFAALVRHPDLEAWLGVARTELADGRWLPALDRYTRERLPSRPSEFGGDQPAAVRDAVHELLAPLGRAPQPLPAWSGPVLDILRSVYADRQLSRASPAEERLAYALRAIADRLRQHADPGLTGSLCPRVTAVEALAFVLDGVARQTLPEPGGQPAVELLGWLEIHLDDAPALVVTGFNEGSIPESVSGDAFLPEGLRRALGLLDNRQRYARDAAVLQAKLRSCERVSLIAGRVGERGDPLRPSRLLFACDPGQVVARARDWYERRPAAAPVWLPVASDRKSQFAVPRPTSTTPVRVLRVTDFSAYLRCPYRFYLQRILGLEDPDDRAAEMDGLLFGRIAHDVLAAFGRSDVRNSNLAGAIVDFLDAELERQARARFGQVRSPIVEVQLRQLRRRLRRFAAWHAGQVAAGWRVQRDLVEAKVDANLSLPNPSDGSVIVRGRIDRIDVHQETRAVRLFDYKTGSWPQKPEETHRQGRAGAKSWIDLQLPLYALLARALGLDGEPPQLGYINLPADLAKTGESLAEWNPEELEDAQEMARAVAGRIIGGLFWPPADPDPDPRREAVFAGICFDRCADRSDLLRAVGGAL